MTAAAVPAVLQSSNHVHTYGPRGYCEHQEQQPGHGQQQRYQARVLDGRAVAAEWQEELAAAVREVRARGGRTPGLGVVLVGSRPDSLVYVARKREACERVGIRAELHHLPASVGQRELEACVRRLCADPAIDGVLVQLPLPPHINEEAIIGACACGAPGGNNEAAGQWPGQPELLLHESGMPACVPTLNAHLCCTPPHPPLGPPLTHARERRVPGPCQGRRRLPPAERGPCAHARRHRTLPALYAPGHHAAAGARRRGAGRQERGGHGRQQHSERCAGGATRAVADLAARLAAGALPLTLAPHCMHPPPLPAE